MPFIDLTSVTGESYFTVKNNSTVKVKLEDNASAEYGYTVHKTWSLYVLQPGVQADMVDTIVVADGSASHGFWQHDTSAPLPDMYHGLTTTHDSGSVTAQLGQAWERLSLLS